MYTENRKSLRKAVMALGTMAVLGSAVASANTAEATFVAPLLRPPHEASRIDD